jgi:hypothetical protein
MAFTSKQPFTAQQVLEELKKHGVTSMDELAQKIAEQSAAKAVFDKARGLSPGEDMEYLWTGHNYSLYHPDGGGTACW